MKQTVIGIADDRISEKEKTLAYFSKNSVFYYREFVEDIGYKYIVVHVVITREQSVSVQIMRSLNTGERSLALSWTG